MIEKLRKSIDFPYFSYISLKNKENIRKNKKNIGKNIGKLEKIKETY